MSTKTKALLAVLALIASFAFGRYSVPTSIRNEKETDTQTEVDKHKETTIVETEKPDGTKEKKTVIVEDSSKKVDRNIKESKQVIFDGSRTTISALAGVNISNLPTLYFGASVSKPVIGPITAGVFYLSPGIVGASIGLSF